MSRYSSSDPLTAPGRVQAVESPQAPWRPRYPVLYLTGKHSRAIQYAAARRGDIGLLVTPLLPEYLRVAGLYPWIGIDNGVFSKRTPFDPGRFVDLVDRAAADERVRRRTLFVACPDRVCDARATLALWEYWSPRLRASGLPVAFVAQDGSEGLPLPWSEMDVLFLGGSTAWKLGLAYHERRGSRGQFLVSTTRTYDWFSMLREAERRKIPVHMGRVNSYRRLDIAEYGLGCRSVDGTFLAHGPRVNLARLERWLNLQNNRDDQVRSGQRGGVFRPRILR